MKLITDFTLAVTPSDEEGNLCLELVEPVTAEVLEHHVRVLRRVSVGGCCWGDLSKYHGPGNKKKCTQHVRHIGMRCE
jgi:hypothetical protein